MDLETLELATHAARNAALEVLRENGLQGLLLVITLHDDLPDNAYHCLSSTLTPEADAALLAAEAARAAGGVQ